VAEKVGDAAPKGMVFKARVPTGRIWTEGPAPEDNLITTRILWLEGLEPGKNAGHDAAGRLVDTKARFVYLHGTNQASRLGTPNSHGCVLLSDDDILDLFDRAPVGTPVYLR
jgi:lipoprotein-anchoring transpeptidase ErfK/SrfK